jgi:hypothetical protein
LGSFKAGTEVAGRKALGPEPTSLNRARERDGKTSGAVGGMNRRNPELNNVIVKKDVSEGYKERELPALPIGITSGAGSRGRGRPASKSPGLSITEGSLIDFGEDGMGGNSGGPEREQGIGNGGSYGAGPSSYHGSIGVQGHAQRSQSLPQHLAQIPLQQPYLAGQSSQNMFTSSFGPQTQQNFNSHSPFPNALPPQQVLQYPQSHFNTSHNPFYRHPQPQLYQSYPALSSSSIPTNNGFLSPHQQLGQQYFGTSPGQIQGLGGYIPQQQQSHFQVPQPQAQQWMDMGMAGYGQARQ